MNDEVDDTRESDQPEGRYANYFKLGHNAFEIVLDFGQFYPEGDKAQLHTRIITSPTYAKALLKTLRESMDRYEETFGTIHEVQGSPHHGGTRKQPGESSRGTPAD